eukprot:TRINITY_DN1072_c1_g1_i2.p2 TRINITY_DN1072_c1_g1~~TRINITY_DN1072_c1_g1_i2.p2  ORF type:complete len:201 (+),score=24.83 TRINITY_DN1072_c1_g1_i2:82-603(+)
MMRSSMLLANKQSLQSMIKSVGQGVRHVGGGIWRELDEMQNTMEQMMDMMGRGLFEERGPLTQGMQVYLDVQETENEFVLKADVPGLAKEDIKLQISEDGSVSISGERKYEKEEEKEGIYHSERAYGKFFRSFKFPKAIKTDEVKAKHEHGVLTLTAPKAVPDKIVTKEITIE